MREKSKWGLSFPESGVSLWGRWKPRTDKLPKALPEALKTEGVGWAADQAGWNRGRDSRPCNTYGIVGGEGFSIFSSSSAEKDD